jgi:hypothetical protein
MKAFSAHGPAPMPAAQAWRPCIDLNASAPRGSFANGLGRARRCSSLGQHFTGRTALMSKLCSQCGRCCLMLGAEITATQEDVARWVKEGRPASQNTASRSWPWISPSRSPAASHVCAASPCRVPVASRRGRTVHRAPTPIRDVIMREMGAKKGRGPPSGDP